jgi:hypothetical protein
VRHPSVVSRVANRGNVVAVFDSMPKIHDLHICECSLNQFVASCRSCFRSFLHNHSTVCS